MAAVTHAVVLNSTSNNQASYTTPTFVPAVGDLLLALIHNAGAVPSDGSVSVDTPTGGPIAFSRIITALKASSADTLFAFVATSLVASAVNHTVRFNAGDDATAVGCTIQVLRVSGMTLTGLSAIRQSAKTDNNAAGGTPDVIFVAPCLTTNPVIGCVANNDNPAGVTEPGSFTELNDSGYSTPTRGTECASANSGITSSGFSWGSTSASAYGTIGLELDVTAASFVPYPRPRGLDGGLGSMSGGMH